MDVLPKLKKKAAAKCSCGKNVSLGSVFCPSCRVEVLRKNDIIMKQEDNQYQKSTKGRGKKRK